MKLPDKSSCQQTEMCFIDIHKLTHVCACAHVHMNHSYPALSASAQSFSYEPRIVKQCLETMIQVGALLSWKSLPKKNLLGESAWLGIGSTTNQLTTGPNVDHVPSLRATTRMT